MSDLTNNSSNFDLDTLRDIMKRMTKVDNSEITAEKEESILSTTGELCDDEIFFAQMKASEELEIIRTAWLEFLEKIKDLAITEALIFPIRQFGEGFVQIELAVLHDLKGQPIQKILENYAIKSRILAVELSKHIKREENN